jgi:hypothetical protein
MSFQDFLDGNVKRSSCALSLASRLEQEIIDKERPDVFKTEPTQKEQMIHEKRRRKFLRDNPDFAIRMGLKIPEESDVES